MSKEIKSHRQRVRIAMPVFVYGHHGSGPPFKEMAATDTVFAKGAVINLFSSVTKGQQLLLVNPTTQQEIICSVVALRKNSKGARRVEIAFDQHSPRFWGLVFPPADWNPANRKLPEPKSNSDLSFGLSAFKVQILGLLRDAAAGPSGSVEKEFPNFEQGEGAS